MIQLRGTAADGTPTYFMGLTSVEANKVVLEGIPLVAFLNDLTDPSLKIVLLYGRNEQQIIDYLAAQGAAIEVSPEETGPTS